MGCTSCFSSSSHTSIRGKDAAAEAWNLSEMSYHEYSRDWHEHAKPWWKVASLQDGLSWKLLLGLSCRLEVVCTRWGLKRKSWCQRKLRLNRGWEGGARPLALLPEAKSWVETGGMLSMVMQCSWPDSSCEHLVGCMSWVDWHVQSTRAAWALRHRVQMKTLPSSALGALSLRVTPHVESIILVYCNTTLFWQSRLNSYYPIRLCARIMSRLFMWLWLGKYFPLSDTNPLLAPSHNSLLLSHHPLFLF